MTTTVLVHLPPNQKEKRLLIETFDRVYDHDKRRSEWQKVDYVFVQAGSLYQTYCTDTRRVLISEVPAASEVST